MAILLGPYSPTVNAVIGMEQDLEVNTNNPRLEFINKTPPGVEIRKNNPGVEFRNKTTLGLTHK